MTDRPLHVHILTDGKMGDLVQCRGVAANLAPEVNIQESIVEPGWLTALPLPNMPLSAVDRQSALMATKADIVIASGRRTVPYLRALKKRRGKSCFTVYLKDPTFNHDSIDVIWAPDHDRLSKPNAFSTATSPHTISAQRLALAKSAAQERFASFPSPNLGLILGGTTAGVDWNQHTIDRFCTALSHIPVATNILVVPSRRTPENLLQGVEAALSKQTTYFWSGKDENPYVEILAYCNRLVVTGDSHNMVSESLASGCPVHVFRPDGLARKLTLFLDGLEAENLIRDVSAGFEGGFGKRLDATPQIADEILKRYQHR